MKKIICFAVIVIAFGCTSPEYVSQIMSSYKNKLNISTGSLKEFSKGNEKVILNFKIMKNMPDSTFVKNNYPKGGTILPLIIVNYFNQYMRIYLGKVNTEPVIDTFLKKEIVNEIVHTGNFQYTENRSESSYIVNIEIDTIYAYNDFYESITFGIPYYVHNSNFEFSASKISSVLSITNCENNKIVFKERIRSNKNNNLSHIPYIEGDELFKWAIKDMNDIFCVALKYYVIEVVSKVNEYFLSVRKNK